MNKDPFDGASVYYAYKNISGDSKKSFFINNNDTASISASLNTTKEQKDLFSNGYIITSVITSYSIHYTKLYEYSIAMLLENLKLKYPGYNRNNFV